MNTHPKQGLLPPQAPSLQPLLYLGKMNLQKEALEKAEPGIKVDALTELRTSRSQEENHKDLSKEIGTACEL
jgi:hypothetical protein